MRTIRGYGNGRHNAAARKRGTNRDTGTKESLKDNGSTYRKDMDFIMTKKTNETELFYEERVPVILRRPPEAPIGSSQTVTINGKNYQVMFDEEVMVPRKVKLILDEKLRNEKRAELRMAQMAEKVQSLDGE